MARQRILVTGATGNLGQDLLDHLRLLDGYDIVGTGSGELNLAWSKEAIRKVLDELKPDVIVNSAAFTQVDAAETRYDLALKVNQGGPEAFAEWSFTHHGYLIHISTDYVFDGTKGTLYNPTDLPNPINRYGLSKRLGEEAVLNILPSNGLVLRTSWLFGRGARNFVPFLIQAAKSQSPVQITMDQWGTPTWTVNLCRMIAEAIRDRPAGILHGCSTGLTSRLEQARFLCECLGVSSAFITPATTESFRFPAKRPLNTAMNSSFRCATDWQSATQQYIQSQGLLKNHV